MDTHPHEKRACIIARVPSFGPYTALRARSDREKVRDRDSSQERWDQTRPNVRFISNSTTQTDRISHEVSHNEDDD